MSLIDVSDLTFAYDGGYDYIFQNVSFQLDTDWRLGFTGRNGRGKTTFLKLLMGEYDYQGTISASVDFEYFPYPVPDPQADTADVLAGVCPDAPAWKLRRELGKLAVDEGVLYRPFATLSNGERTKALLAAMFLRENAFLLIDEPTNHLDMRGRALVSAYLAQQKGYILVSHDRAFLDGCVDHILSINRADIQVCRGNFSTWWANKQAQDRLETEQNERLKKEVKRLKTAARQKEDWSNTAERRKTGVDRTKVDNIKGWAPLQGAKAKKQMSRAKAIETRRERAVEEKSKLLKNIETAEELKLDQPVYRSPRLAYLKDVAVDYGDGPVCEPVSFTLERGDRVALLGANGAGKSSVLKLLCGEDIPHTGQVEVGGGLVISYVPQDTGDLAGSLTGYAERCGVDVSLFLAILRKLDFERSQFEKDMAAFSAGQKKKVLLARSLCERAHLLVWDEPLNYIDLISRMQIEELLLRARPTLLVVEHDRAFCERVATRTVEL